MNTEELIPVLKALHADPSCSLVFADWFEERSDNELATWLRANGAIVPTGTLLIESLWKLPSVSRDAIRYAVVAEAIERFNVEWRIPFADVVRLHIDNETRNAIVTNTGRDRQHWKYVDIDGHTAGVGRSDFTYLQRRPPNDLLFGMETGIYHPRPNDWAPLPLAVQMQYGTVGYHFGVNRMDGGPLAAYADIWFGVTGDTVYVSEFRPEHVRFWR